MTGHAVYCISAGRALNVPATQLMFSPDRVTWVVPVDQVPEYRAAGAAQLMTAPPLGEHGNLPAARNTALDHAAAMGVWCVQADDDITRLAAVGKTNTGKWTATPTPWPQWRRLWMQPLADEPDARLLGVPPTPNPMFAGCRISLRAFCVGALFAAHPASPVRFDPDLPLKEDYDYTCRHLQAHGRVLRNGNVVVTHRQRTNRGGVVAYRTDQLEHDIAGKLVARWPGYLRPHHSRDHEVILR